MRRWLLLLMGCTLAIHTFAQAPKPVLEHTFEGLYNPYNMEVYNPISDDDRYFYPVSLNINGGHIQAAIYNEDYSVREQIDCTIDIPTGYKISSVQIGGNMILPDGTNFFIVNFSKEDHNQLGYADYEISKAYSSGQGNPLLFDIASASFMLSALSPLYVINGKLSLIMLAYEYDLITRTNVIKTCVYSLGEVGSSSANEIHQDGYQPYPIRTYDMNGRLVNMDSQGVPVIIQYSDGSAIKTVK
ncbi:MAG: hypothetical protein K1V84_12610 [Muribaculaceae bacterium]